MDSGIWSPTGDQADVNLLVSGFILLHFIQKGGADFGLIERQSKLLLQAAQSAVQIFNQDEVLVRSVFLLLKSFIFNSLNSITGLGCHE